MDAPKTLPPELNKVLEEYKDVFEGLGELRGYEATLHIDPNVKPRFCPPRPVPYAVREKVEQELKRLQETGIIEPVQFSDWASPIVPVTKEDKSMRLCGDFKQTINRASKLDRYPIPRIEDLFARLTGGKKFTKLDISQAYQQLVLEKKSREYVVINTHKGLFSYNRLPFGVSSAPGIFQRVMESILGDMPGVVVYFDDILITAPTDEEHIARVAEVLGRLRKANLRLKRPKCRFMAPSVTYLGYVIDAEGLHPVPEKVEAIRQAPRPTTVAELKSYLGLVTYYSKFLRDLASTPAPLYKLLRRDVPWRWTSEQEKAFERSKELLLSSQVLVHFNPKLPIKLACDASDYGLGVVLSHEMANGTEKPVGFYSRTLSDTERKYSQIEKEALACVVGVTRFHSYLWGHHFILQTDHKPLLTLFHQHKSIPQQAANRIQRWAWKLAGYEYTIEWRATGQHSNADGLSRLPLIKAPRDTTIPAELVLLMEQLEEAPVTARQIATLTRRDPVLALVYRYIQEGWPNTAGKEEVKPYWNRRLELSTLNGCILWGNRVVIPPPARETLLTELHSGHPGSTRMKAVARGLLWWPLIDTAIEGAVNTCPSCQQVKPLPPVAPLRPWAWPSRAWSRLHVDFAGPMGGRMFLVVIDAYSKWLEVFPMSTTTSSATISQLRTLFARFGLPETLVSDNGPQLASTEFAEFCRGNGIHHVMVAPYHPSSNGMAERAVRVFKEGLKKQQSGSLTDRLAKFLFHYWNTPHSTTGMTPAELLLGRKLRSRLDLIKPDLTNQVVRKQNKQKAHHDQHARQRSFREGDSVYVKNHRDNGKGAWLSGHISKVTGPVSYVVVVEGQEMRCHQDHVRSRVVNKEAEKQEFETQEGDFETEDVGAAEETPEPRDGESPVISEETPSRETESHLSSLITIRPRLRKTVRHSLPRRNCLRKPLLWLFLLHQLSWVARVSRPQVLNDIPHVSVTAQTIMDTNSYVTIVYVKLVQSFKGRGNVVSLVNCILTRTIITLNDVTSCLSFFLSCSLVRFIQF